MSAELVPPHPSETPIDRRRSPIPLSGEATKLFLVGHARSGTTITMDLLNSCRDVALLCESNIHLRHWSSTFVSDFNQQHAETGYFPQKGRYLSLDLTGQPPLKILDHLAKSYRIVGEKIAFGPHGMVMGRYAQDIFLDFHLSHFMDANYLFTVRPPSESLLSARAVFPGAGAGVLFDGWLRSLDAVIAGSRLFPNNAILPLEWLDETTARRITDALGVSGRFGADWFRPIPRDRAAAVDKLVAAPLFGELAEHLGSEDAARATIEAAEDLYDDLVGHVDPETLWYREGFYLEHLDQETIPRIRKVTADVNARGGEAEVLYYWVNGKLEKTYNIGGFTRFTSFAKALEGHVFSEEGGNLFLSPEDMLGPNWSLSGLHRQPAIEGPGILLLEDGESSGQKSFGQFVPVPAEGRIVTFRLSVRPAGRDSVVLQFGDSKDFWFAMFDLKSLSVSRMVNFGGARSLQARLQPLPGNWFQLAITGQPPAGLKNPCAWIYVSNGTTDLAYPGEPSKGLYVSDPYLSTSRAEACGVL